MSETTGSGIGGNALPEVLLPSQILVQELSRDLLAGEMYINQFDRLAMGADATTVRATLDAVPSLHDMLVRPGEELRPNPTEFRGSETGFATPGVDAVLSRVSYGTFGTSLEKRRFIPADRAHEYDDIDPSRVLALHDGILVDYPGEYDWRGDVHVTFWYDTPTGKVGERLAVSSWHAFPGQMPEVESSVLLFHPDRPDSGPTAWRRLVRPAASEEEVALLVDTVRALRDSSRPE